MKSVESSGVSGASVATGVWDCTMGGSGKGGVVAAIAPVVTIVVAAAFVAFATFTLGAIFAPRVPLPLLVASILGQISILSVL